MAGFILSSFPPERMRRSPHQRMKSIERSPAARTKSEIASKINSPKSSLPAKIEPSLATLVFAYAVAIRFIYISGLVEYFYIYFFSEFHTHQSHN